MDVPSEAGQGRSGATREKSIGGSGIVKLFGLILLALPTIIALCGAVFLAAKDKDGWGWLLLLAVMFSPPFRILQEFLP